MTKNVRMVLNRYGRIALTGDKAHKKKKLKLWQKICTKKINKAYKLYSDKK